MVFDVAASSGGALTILKDFYEKALIDDSNQWIFILSTPILKDGENVKIKNFKWVKKSWFHRIYFEFFVPRYLIKRYLPDKILSLQNLIVLGTKIKQTVYLHQSLPFSNYKFSILTDSKLWFYQNIMGYLIKKSIFKAEFVIVQTNWMKLSCVKKLGISENKIIVQKPFFKILSNKKFNISISKKIEFFYPSSGDQYKNHILIIKALLVVNKSILKNIKIIFTLNGNENKNIMKLKSVIIKNKLPVDFVGFLPINKVFEYYKKSILLFPSFIETIGLPLIEAKEFGTPIIVADLPYSREALLDYNKVYFFDPFCELDLLNQILACINNLNTIKLK
jgi:glycosyltransferase involved in cell wall biosynthesis